MFSHSFKKNGTNSIDICYKYAPTVYRLPDQYKEFKNKNPHEIETEQKLNAKSQQYFDNYHRNIYASL